MKTYPTRIQKIGEMKCIFFSFYKSGSIPFCGIGPSWCFTLLLFFLVMLTILYVGFMCSILYQFSHSLAEKVMYLEIVISIVNLIFLILVVFSEPGVP